MRGSNEPLNPLNVIHIEHLDFNGAPSGPPIETTPLYDALKGVSEQIDRARERQVFDLINEGYTNRQITGLLNLSVETVEAHRFTTMRKLNLSSLADLVRYAIRNQIVLTP